jgi:TRAP-type C4-dicarboxylate transport system substrate-binding protein
LPLQILELPFLVRDRQAVWAALDGELGQHLRHRLHATAPFRVLAPLGQRVRAGVDEAAVEATGLQRQLAASEDMHVLAKLDPRENDVIRLTAAEHAAFVQAVQPVVPGYRKELFDQIPRSARNFA